MSQPNIIYIHSHDTGRYIQPYGHAVKTPNLQKLAEQGVLFRQNFCVNPTCSPSRAALLTGCYPHENGMTGLVNRGWRLHDYDQHMVHTLKQAGYETVLAGLQHVAPAIDGKAPWQVIGYDRFLEGEAEGETAVYLNQPHERPFFLAVGFFEAHREFPPLEDIDENPNYCLPPAPLPDTPEMRQDMARYKASVAQLDAKIGVVLEALEKSGLAENTLVICTTDHGLAFPKMKCNLQDSGIGTMLILRGPGRFAGGKVVDQMTSHLDLFPTLCELAAIDRPNWLRGKSLLPLMDDSQDELHNALYFQVNYHAAFEPMRAVRTPRWKYIRRFDDRKTVVLPNIDEGESKSYLLAHGLQTAQIESELLFDLIFDPNEANNLASHPTHQKTLNEMRARLDEWMVETNDPLRNGRVFAPATGMINDPNAMSPKEPLHPIGE
ncbi:MAG: sulfatase [Chloroflexota bacterium]